MIQEKRILVITVVNSLSPTSMPYNEFVLYRRRHMPQIQQALIVCAEAPERLSQELEGIDVYYVGRSILKIRKALLFLLQHGKTVIHLHQPMSALLTYIAGSFVRRKKSLIFTVHNVFSAYNVKNALLSLLSSLCAHEITFVSVAAFRAYPSFVKRIKQKKTHTITNGVDLKRIDRIVDRKMIRPGNVPRQLVYVARMVPVKRHAFLVQLLRHVPNCKLLLIGAEDDSGEIRHIAEQEGVLDRITFSGLVSREAVFDMLSKADIYVSTSAVEGMPVSVLEAMAVGLPVILSDIEPHMEIKHFCSGVVTVPFQTKEWIEVLSTSVGKSDEALRAWGRECRQCVEEHFSLSAMNQAYEDIYRKMANELGHEYKNIFGDRHDA
jgi:glycosyltransferase involved in cell wall biosynthesis